LSLNADGSFSYTPDENFNGANSFTYHANDGVDDSNIVTVLITVNAVNDIPTADAGGPYSETLGQPVFFDGTASSDIDGDSITYAWNFGDGNNGSGVNPSHTYTTAETFSVTLVVNDGTVDSSPSISSAVISPLNNPPVVYDQSVQLTGSSIVITLSGSDLDGDSCTFSIVSQPPDGRLKKLKIISPTEAEITYTPKRSFTGTDSFEFMVNDGTDNSNVATVTITEDVPANTPPVANDDSDSVDKAGTVTVNLAANDIDDDDGLDLTSIQIVSGPSNGSVVVNADGTVDYTHDDSETTSDSFTYTIKDNSVATSNIATVDITINGPVSETLVHLGNLVGVPSAKGPWNIGTVEITVHDSGEVPISGVVVSVIWSDLFSGTDSCTTNASGICSVTDRIKNISGTATLTVQTMSGSGIVYDFGSNDIPNDFISFLVS